MNWEAISATGEVVGATAVILTLIYLSIQVRQNTKSMDESRKVEIGRTVQSRTELRFELHRAILQSPELMNAMMKMRESVWPQIKEAFQSLTPEEREAFFTWSRMQIMIIETIYSQRDLGLISDDVFQNTRPAIEKWGRMWREIGALNGIRKPFLEEVDKILAHDS